MARPLYITEVHGYGPNLAARRPVVLSTKKRGERWAGRLPELFRDMTVFADTRAGLVHEANCHIAHAWKTFVRPRKTDNWPRASVELRDRLRAAFMERKSAK